MDTLISIVAAALILTYGGLSIWLLLRQRRASHALWTGGGLLLGGVLLYQFLFTIASFIAWGLVIALGIYILSLIFG